VELDIVVYYRSLIKENPDIAPPVAAVKSLLVMVERSQAKTMSELAMLLETSADILARSTNDSLPLQAGCALFKRFFVLTTEHIRDLEVGKKVLLGRGQRFVEQTADCRDSIAQLGARFVKDGMTVLVHSYSRVVSLLLQRAFKMNTRFTVIVTEARPTCSGARTAQKLMEVGVPVTMIPDAAVAWVMGRVDLVLLGAEVVTENGGLVSQIGTFQVAVMAHTMSKPCYAVVESYKFFKGLPLGQQDLPVSAPSALHDTIPKGDETTGKDGWEWLRPNVDFTPPRYISLLITDLGVLTPAGVGDELFRMYG